MASIFGIDWSWLPAELFSEIFDRLSVVDRIRSGCVCKSWRCAAEKKQILRRPPLESPWLMFSDPVKGCNFYSVDKKKFYRMNDDLLPGPDIRKRSWVGSSEGWLITADERAELHLLNPVTCVQIPLPSILSLPCIYPVRDLEGRLRAYHFCADIDYEHPIKYSTGRTRELLFVHGKGVVKWWNSGDPDTASWTVMLLFMPGPKLAYARSEDDVWTPIGDQTFYDDLLLSDGFFYTFTCPWLFYRIGVWDLTTTGHPYRIRTITAEFEFPDIDRFHTFYPYLVVSSSRILMVRRERETREGEEFYRTHSFEVYQLDDDGGKFKWTRMQTLEDRAIFIGLNSCISLSSHDLPGLEGDCIYFTDDHWEGALSERERTRDIGVCSLKDGTITSCYPQDFPKLNWPPPIWITPSLL